MASSGRGQLVSTLSRPLRRLLARLVLPEDSFLLLLSVGIGLGTGLGAWAFSKMLEGTIWFCYHFLGDRLSLMTGGRGVWLIPLVPAAGGLLVGLIVHYFAREAKGHGVPEVMDAIARKGGVIRPRVSLAKAVASALCIGSGGSAGTEGPIVQIGAALGSSSGQLLGRQRRHLPVLIGCGAAAGISAIFNAPIAGVLFALEIFLYDFSVRTFTPLVLSSVVSATITHTLLGQDKAMLELPKYPEFAYQFQWWETGNYVVLGLLAGLLAVVYIKALYGSEDLFDIRLRRISPVIRPVLGGLLLGLLGVLMFRAFPGVSGDHQPAVFGNGYPFIKALFHPDAYAAGQLTILLLGAFLAAKLLATCLTLGSGGSGGVFAPSLFMGAALGGLFGLLLRKMGMDVNPVAYAVVGMAAVFAGSTHAFLTGIVMLFEMTRDYRVMLPVMLAATIATVVKQLIKRESIYTEKLVRRGIATGLVADMTLLRRLAVDQLARVPATFARENAPLTDLIATAAEHPVADFVVVDDNDRYRGMVVGEDLRVALLEREAVPLLLVAELLRPDIPTVGPSDTLASVLEKFSRHDVSALPVADPVEAGRIIGLVTRSGLMRRYQQELSREHGYGQPRRPRTRDTGRPPVID